MKCIYEGCGKASESGTGYCEEHYSEYDEYAEMTKAELRREALSWEMAHDESDDLAPMSLAYEARMRYLQCREYLGYYRQWWFLIARATTQFHRERLAFLTGQMQKIWDRLSEPQRLFIQSRPDPIA